MTGWFRRRIGTPLLGALRRVVTPATLAQCCALVLIREITPILTPMFRRIARAQATVAVVAAAGASP